VGPGAEAPRGLIDFKPLFDVPQVLRCVVASPSNLPLHYTRLVEIGVRSIEHQRE
jgi:hypothetical protein